MSSVDWLIWILSGSIIVLLLLVFLVRSRLIIQALQKENEQYRNRILSSERSINHTQDGLRKIKYNMDQSFSEVESLNQQVSSLLDKNRVNDLNHFEQQYQGLLELVQSQKNFIYRAITTASSEEANKFVMTDLINFVEEVSSKSKIIHDIAFKTKVLSFNASVEAERAGARGRGFSIVAQEMKRLAEISGQSSEEIATLVERTRRGTQMFSAQMSGDSLENVSVQNTLVEVSGNLEQFQAKLSDLNSYWSSLLNQKSDDQNHIERVVDLIHKISLTQSETRMLNDKILASQKQLAS